MYVPLLFRAEVETGFGGLVVAGVFRGYAEAVGDIFHQTRDAVIGGDGRDVESQFGALAVADEHLLAPVAQDVGRETGVRLRAVVELAVEPLDSRDLMVLPVVFRYSLVVEQLT